VIDTATRNGRSEADILARSGLALVLGGTTYYLRPLSMAAAEEWESRIRTLIGDTLGGLGDMSGGIEGLLSIGHTAVAAQLDALYAYDELGTTADGLPSALPQRERVFQTASRDDLATALRKLVEHEFPLLRSGSLVSQWIPNDVREIIGRHLIRLLVDSSPPELSSSASSTSIPGPVNRAARRRSAKA